MVIRGRGLGTPGLEVRLGSQRLTPSDDERRSGELRLALTSGRLGGQTLAAGLNPVRLIAPPPDGAPAHLGRASEVAVLPLRPRVTVAAPVLSPETTAEAATGTVDLTLTPPLAEEQEVRVSLDPLSGEDASALVLDPDIPEVFPAQTLSLSFSGLARVRYLVSVQIDGVGSLLEIDRDASSPTLGRLIGPALDLEPGA